MNKTTDYESYKSDIMTNAKICPPCKSRNESSVYKKGWMYFPLVFITILITSVFTSCSISGYYSNETSSNTRMVSSKSAAFDGDCGITASAEMGSNIIGSPELTISITNTTSQDISAIRFYAVPYDVYGDEITGWTTQHKLYTDTTIEAGKSTSISYQFIEDRIKTIKLYVYSIYFSDGTEWGDKEAAKSTILKNGAVIKVSGES